MKATAIICITFAALFSLLIMYAGVYIALAVCAAKSNKESTDLDYLIILGAWTKDEKPGKELALRIERAADFMKKNPNTTAIATGGCFRKGQRKAEAVIIKNGLVELGIDKSRILIEDKSKNTYENFEFSKAIINSADKSTASVGILTNKFHLLRAKKIAAQKGFAQAVMIAADSPKNPARLYIREAAVIAEVLVKGIGN